MASRIERNYAIDFYRFLFTCIIFILHFRPYGNFGGQNGQFNGGYLGVEFFFIVSGFLMMANLKSKISNESVEYTASDPVYAEKETWNFFAQRFMRLMPQYWFSLIVLLAVQYIVLPDFNLIESIQKGFPDLFAIQIFWIPQRINIHVWYVSALLWASTLIYYLLLKKRHLFVYIIFPLLLLFTVGFIYRNKGHIDLTYDVYGFLRAFSEVGFGCVLCEIIDHIKDKKIRINPVLVTAVEIILLAVILYVMYRTRRDYKDFVMVFLIGALIFITFLGEGRFSKLLNRKTFRKLGEICYVMYLNQGVFQFIFRSCFPGLPFWITTVFLIFILAVYSAILLRLERSIKDYVYSLRSI